MRKIIIAIGLALSLGACATITNPIGRVQLAGLESAVGTAVATFNGYKRLCGDRVLPPSCRTAVIAVQDQLPRVQGALNAARGFVRDYPTLNAATAIGAAQSALSDFQAVQAKYGVK